MNSQCLIGALLSLALLATPPLSLAQDQAQDQEDTGQAPESQEPQNDTAFKEDVHVSLLQLPILALDKKGAPVTDLRPDEIQVKLSGKPIELAFLEPFIKTAKKSDPLPDVRLSVDLPGGPESVITSTGEEVRHIIVFIDVENDQPLGKKRAIRDLVGFAFEDLDSSYRTAILSFNGEVHVEQSFTDDRRLISDAVQHAFDRPPRPQLDLKLRIQRLLEAIDECVYDRGDFISSGSQSCLQFVALEYADEVRPRARDYLHALEGVISFAAGLGGRKTVLAITHGVAIEPVTEVMEALVAVLGNTMELSELRLSLMAGEGARIEMDDVIDLAIRREVTLHILDRTIAPAGTSTARSGILYTPGSQPIEAAFRAAQIDSQEIAGTTGGIFLASEDLRSAVKKAIDTERGAYTVGCYLNSYLPRKIFSKFSVKSKRPGVRITHRRGTYAIDQRPGAQDLLRGNITLGRPAKIPRPSSETRVKVPFRIAANAKDLGYERKKDLAVGNFTIHVQLETADGRIAADSYHLVQHAYPWSLWLEEDVEPLTVDGWVELPLGNYRLVATFNNPRKSINADLSHDVNIAESRNPAGSP